MLISETSILKKEIFRLKIENDNLRKINNDSKIQEVELRNQILLFKDEVPRLKKE